MLSDPDYFFDQWRVQILEKGRKEEEEYKVIKLTGLVYLDNNENLIKVGREIGITIIRIYLY